ncbi:hypothetical protein K1719_046403 [Acacia pycnantha]|nr:hypothetical protein K1719_046403 [Acacia pycnantha]
MVKLGLEVISEGLDTLKNMAHDMNEEMDRQVPLMDEIDTKFPGFASENLAKVYFTNVCDLNLSAMNFPTLTSPDGHNTSVKYAADNVQRQSLWII